MNSDIFNALLDPIIHLKFSSGDKRGKNYPSEMKPYFSFWSMEVEIRFVNEKQYIEI